MADIFVAALLVLATPGFCSRLPDPADWVWGFPGVTHWYVDNNYDVSSRNQHLEKGPVSKGSRSMNFLSPGLGKMLRASPDGPKGMGPIVGPLFSGDLRTKHARPESRPEHYKGTIGHVKDCLTVDYYIDPRFEYNVHMIQAALDDISASACVFFRPSKSRSTPLSIMVREEEGEYEGTDCGVFYGKREIHFGKDCLTKKHVMSVVLRWLNYCPADVEEEAQEKVVAPAQNRASLRYNRRNRGLRSTRGSMRRQGNMVLDNGNEIALGEFNKSTVAADSRKLYCEDGLPVCCIIASLNGCSLFYGFTSKFCPGSCNTAVEDNTCEDTNPNCPRWGSENKCLANQALMREICPMSCGFCSPNDFCFDTAPNCQDLAENGECERNPEYMVTACRESCKFCKGHRNCTDHDSNCPSVAGSLECLNEDTQAICPHSCGLCKAHDEPQLCGDFQEECPAYKENGFCESHPKFMHKFCPRACGFCGPAQEGGHHVQVVEEEEGQEQEQEQEQEEQVVGEEEKYCLIGGDISRKCETNPGFIKRYCSISLPGQVMQELLD